MNKKMYVWLVAALLLVPASARAYAISKPRIAEFLLKI